MTSSRLPGKVMMEVCGKSLLDYHVQRLSRCHRIDKLVIATTSNETDEPISQFCEEKNIASFRGSEKDVLERYFLCAQQYNADIIVRVTSDCPLIDPEIVDNIIERYLDKMDLVDYVTQDSNTIPPGQDVEVFSFKALERAYHESQMPFQREHVTPYIYLNADKFTCEKYASDIDFSQNRWCVDELADFKLIKNILEAFSGRDNFTWRDCLSLLEKNPDWTRINQKVSQKTLDE